MANIELVIKIPEEIYEASQILDVKYKDIVRIPLEVIKNGTPLPKGHGRLIDVDAMNIHDVSPAYGMEVYGVTQDDIEYEPTIIEADKESES